MGHGQKQKLHPAPLRPPFFSSAQITASDATRLIKIMPLPTMPRFQSMPSNAMPHHAILQNPHRPILSHPCKTPIGEFCILEHEGHLVGFSPLFGSQDACFTPNKTPDKAPNKTLNTLRPQNPPRLQNTPCPQSVPTPTPHANPSTATPPPAPILSPSPTPLMRECIAQVQAYFDGRLRAFDLPLRLSGSHFRIKALQAISSTPYAHTTTYKNIAEQIHSPRAYRAIGNACHANPLPLIIPCHRVLASHHLGGYALGKEAKIFLLHLEKTYSQKTNKTL